MISIAIAGAGNAGGAAPRSLPVETVVSSGPQTFLLKLEKATTVRASRRAYATGDPAVPAARQQKAEIREAQAEVAESLPDGAAVLYRTYNLLAAIAVTADAGDEAALENIEGVKAVYPIAPKSPSNSYALQLQGAPAAWQSSGSLGEGTSIAIIDTGIDYTHSNFGGAGTISAYDAAQAAEASPAEPGVFPNDKVVGGYDLVGDDYDSGADQGSPRLTPNPDPNPLDCEGHGSHVAGSAAGYGENADGSTYTGDYDSITPFGTMKIGPGVAPKADLYAYRVFGCEGTTNVVAQAIDRAVDPNGDSNFSDHADVINMSLGSEYGSPDDGDSIVANAAVDLGVSLTVSAGNSGDLTDVSGSPGNARKVITVANSQDAETRSDGAEVTIDGTPATFGISRSGEYDWLHEPDLEGTVVKSTPENPTACDAYPASDTFSGQIVLVEWDQDNLGGCGSAARSANVRNAGGGGFIFANTADTFSAGIVGDAVIPGVLMTKTGGDTIRAALTGGGAVEVNSTSIGSVDEMNPLDNNRMAGSSSRGIHAEDNLKPDVTAVGTSVFSAYSGSGDEGTSLTGTSMAAPMVAGLAALVHQEHPGWQPIQVKANIMNTAGQDITVNGADTPPGATYPPVRAGAGRIEADAALANEVLAFGSQAGGVSLSFGPVEVTEPMTLTKEVTVQNTGSTDVSYDAGYESITSVPGVSYSVYPASFTVAAEGSRTITVTFEVTDPSEMTKTVDPTIGRESGTPGQPRVTLAEASGRIVLTPDPADRPALRVPVYSAPRPAAAMTQDKVLKLTGAGPKQTGDVDFFGSDLGFSGTNGTGDADPADDIVSRSAGFELQASSPQVAECVGIDQSGCYRIPEDRAADIEYVGYTSNMPTTEAADGRAYFAVSTHAPSSIPANRTQIQFDIDVDGDKVADLFLFNDRKVDEDIFVATLVGSGNPDSSQFLNIRNGATDTALYDSDAMILPVSLPLLSSYGINADNPRITYGVESYSGFSGDPIDLVGIDPGTGKLDGSLSADLYSPGVKVTDGATENVLQFDRNGTDLTVERNSASYEADQGKGLLMLHLHNAVGDKAQVAALKGSTTTALAVSPSNLSATVAADGQGAPQPGGSVSFTVGGKVVGSGELSGNTATLVYKVPTGSTRRVTATYSGDDDYMTSSSTVDRPDPEIRARLTSKRAKNGRGWYRAPVTATFSCVTHGSGLSVACPSRVTLSADGANQSLVRTILALDGGGATAIARNIDIDRTRPKVVIRGFRKGLRYRKAPRGRCVARDATSGVASCRLRKRRRGNRVTYTAKATDRAGNTQVKRKVIRLAPRRR